MQVGNRGLRAGLGDAPGGRALALLNRFSLVHAGRQAGDEAADKGVAGGRRIDGLHHLGRMDAKPGRFSIQL